MKSIVVERLNPAVIKMSWTKNVTNQDVSAGFRQVNDLLNALEQPSFVMVDILADPNFPIAATLTGALFGPYRNPNLREWLILGSNPAARFIERTLSGATGRLIVRWFDSQEQALAYVAQQVDRVA